MTLSSIGVEAQLPEAAWYAGGLLTERGEPAELVDPKIKRPVVTLVIFALGAKRSACTKKKSRKHA